VWGSVVSSPNGVGAEPQPLTHFCGIKSPGNASGDSNHLFGHGVLENLIPALSRTFRHRFKDFQGPRLFSRTFQALKIWKKSRTFKDLQKPWFIHTYTCHCSAQLKQMLDDITCLFMATILTLDHKTSQPNSSVYSSVLSISHSQLASQ